MTAVAQNNALAASGTTLSSRIGSAFRRMQENRARGVIYRQTVRELGELTSRELADLGINRSMIEEIALEASSRK